MAKDGNTTGGNENTVAEAVPPAIPTVSIYQNSEHVSGILQQLFGEPLVTDQSRETLNERKDSSGSSTNKGGGASVTVKAPIVQGSIKGALRGSW